MPTKKTPVILQMGVELDNFKKELQTALSSIRKVKSEFGDISSEEANLVKMMEMVNKAMAIYSTKADSTGKVSLKDAKELVDIYTKLQTTILNVSDAETSRLSPKLLKQRIEDLTKESSVLQTNIKLLEEQEKKRSELKSSNINVVSVMSEEDRKKLSGYVTSETGGILTKTEFRERSKNLDISEEDSKKIIDYYQKARNLASETREEINRLNLEIENTNKIIEVENAKIQALKSQGVSSGLDSSSFQNSVQGTTEALIQNTKEAERNNKGFVDLNKTQEKNTNTFAKAAKTFISFNAVLRVLRAVGNEAIRTIKDMDEALTGMTMVTGKSREEVLKYVDTFKELAQQTSATMTEIANLTTEFLRQGRSMEDSLVLAEETAKAAKIAGISVTDSIQYMTSTLNGFNMAASEASYVSDVFAKVAVSTATDYEQLAVALSKVSAQANLAGMSMEFTTSLLAKGIEVTQEAPESIGTALKTVVARMRELSDYNKVLEDGTSVNKVEKALSAAGIALRNQNGEFRDLEVIFNELGPRWEKLNSNQQQAIAQAVAGTRQQSRFVAIMQDWNRTLEITADAANSAGEATYEYNQYAKGLTATMDRLTTSWQGFTTSLVNTEFIIGILDKVTGLLNVMSEMSGFFKVILVSITGIVAQQKLSNLLQEHRKNKLAQSMALENQLTEEQKLQLEAEKQSLSYAKQKVKVLEYELRLAEQKRLSERASIKAQLDAAVKDGSLKLKKDGSYDMRTSKNNKDLVERYNLLEQISSSEENISLLKTQEENILRKINSRETNSLLNNIKNIALLLSTFSLKKSILTTEQASIILQNKESMLGKIRLLFLKTERINEELITQEKKDQLLLAKKDAIASIKTLGIQAAKMALIAAAAAAVVLAVKSILEEYHAVERAQEKIIENNDKIYEAKNNIDSLKELIKNYEKLDRKVVKTAEDIQEMADIEKNLFENHQVKSIDAARAKLKEYSQDIVELEADNIEKLNIAYIKGGKEIFEKSEFIDTFNNFIEDKVQQSIDSSLSESERKNANSVSKKLISSINKEDYMNIAKKSGQYDYRNKNAGTNNLRHVGIGAAGVAGAITALALIPGIGWAIAGAVLAVGAATTGIVYSIRDANEDLSKSIEKVKESFNIEKEIANFSSNMAKAIESESMFVDMQKIYNEAKEKEDQAFAKYFIARTAYENFTFKDPRNLKENKERDNLFIALEQAKTEYDNAKIFMDSIYDYKWLGYVDNAEGLDTFVKNSYLSSAQLNSLIEKFHSYGEDISKAFIEGLTNSNKSKEETSEYIKNIIKTGKVGEKDLEGAYNNYYEKTYEEAIKASQGTDFKAIRSALFDLGDSEAYKYTDVAAKQKLEKMLNDIKSMGSEEFIKEIKDSYLSSYSPYTSTLDLSQAITSIDSERKTFDDYIDKAKKGTLTSEDLFNVVGKLSPEDMSEAYSALTSGDTERLSSIIAAARNEITQSEDVMQDYIKMLEEKKDLETDKNIKKSIEEEINMIKALKNSQDGLNSAKLQQLIIDNKISKAQKDLEEGGVSAEKVNNLLEDELLKAKNTANIILKNLGSKYDWETIRSIVNGEKIVDKDQYSKVLEYYNSIESHLKEIDEIEQDIAKNNETALENQLNVQNELLDAYKSQLEQEQEALQESLDKRKEMYEKYFDALDEESSDESFEDQQARLQNAIARLSTANDATSLSKLKEYQEQLAELEKEQLQSERDRRREATMTNLDNESEAIEQYYDSRLENEQVLWEEITKLNKDGLSSLLKDYNEEYQKATDLMKEKLEKDMSELTDFALRMINPELYKVPTAVNLDGNKTNSSDVNNQNIENSTINNNQSYTFNITTDDSITIRNTIEDTMRENGILGTR